MRSVMRSGGCAKSAWMLATTQSSPASAPGGKVERTVGQDVHLDAGEQARLGPAAAERRDPLALLREPVLVEPERTRAGVVRDGEVPPSQPARLLGQLLQSGARVARGLRVHVQVAEDVALLDETRKLARLGGLDLARALAQLGRDPRQPDRREHVLLALSGEPPTLAIEDAVLAQLDAAVHGARADGDVVLPCCR